MNRLENLQQQVAGLYEQKLETRADWADWLYPHHVLIVEQYASELQQRFGGSSELVSAAALLHDIADAKTKRSDPKHGEESLVIAKALMNDCGFNSKEIHVVVDDAIRFHSCHGNERPESIEGKILAAADAMAHLKTDFYLFATSMLGQEKGLDQIKAWALEKIKRDYDIRLGFEDLRVEMKPDYDMLMNLFGR